MYSEVSSIEEGRIQLRGQDLVSKVIGHLGFTEAIHLAIRGELPTASEVKVLDAVLVSLIDHGVTSSTLAARMTYRAAPEAFQGALAAGVLNSGGRVLGAMEGCGRLLADWAPKVESDGVASVGGALVRAERDAGRRIPGLGHALHEEGDLRSARLFEVAEQAGSGGVHIALLLAVVDAVEEQSGRTLPVNVTGAIAAVLLDIGYPPGLLRGFGILSRVPGLIAHLGEEMETGTGSRLVRHLQAGNVWGDLD